MHLTSQVFPALLGPYIPATFNTLKLFSLWTLDANFLFLISAFAENIILSKKAIMPGLLLFRRVCYNEIGLLGNWPKYPVLSPEDAISKYKSAHFLIANRTHHIEIEEQLCLSGIKKSAISVYTLPLLPMECTNYFMKLYQ